MRENIYFLGGTGSYPPGKSGLHRKSLHKASAPPLHAPKRSIASWRKQRRNFFLIKTNHGKKRFFHRSFFSLEGITPAAQSCFFITFSSSVLLIHFVRPLAIKTISQLPKTSSDKAKKAARITRFARLRSTALPIFLLVVIPNRQIPARFLIT